MDIEFLSALMNTTLRKVVRIFSPCFPPGWEEAYLIYTVTKDGKEDGLLAAVLADGKLIDCTSEERAEHRRAKELLYLYWDVFADEVKWYGILLGYSAKGELRTSFTRESLEDLQEFKELEPSTWIKWLR